MTRHDAQRGDFDSPTVDRRSADEPTFRAVLDRIDNTPACDEDTVERVARAMFVADDWSSEQWAKQNGLWDARRDEYRRLARAAVAALKPAPGTEATRSLASDRVVHLGQAGALAMLAEELEQAGEPRAALLADRTAKSYRQWADDPASAPLEVEPLPEPPAPGADTGTMTPPSLARAFYIALHDGDGFDAARAWDDMGGSEPSEQRADYEMAAAQALAAPGTDTSGQAVQRADVDVMPRSWLDAFAEHGVPNWAALRAWDEAADDDTVMEIKARARQIAAVAGPQRDGGAE